MSAKTVRFVQLEGGQELLEADEGQPFLAFIPAESEEAARFLLDPLEFLRPRLHGLIAGENEDWRVTVNRVNGEIPLWWPPKGPHHIIVHGIVLAKRRQVHCTFYRSLDD
jgi:hypothetical protein